jgi:hypothetical protein
VDTADIYALGSQRVFMNSATISMLIRQINAGQGVGATECLRKLIGDNLSLLKTHVNSDTVSYTFQSWLRVRYNAVCHPFFIGAQVPGADRRQGILYVPELA